MWDYFDLSSSVSYVTIIWNYGPVLTLHTVMAAAGTVLLLPTTAVLSGPGVSSTNELRPSLPSFTSFGSSATTPVWLMQPESCRWTTRQWEQSSSQFGSVWPKTCYRGGGDQQEKLEDLDTSSKLTSASSAKGNTTAEEEWWVSGF